MSIAIHLVVMALAAFTLPLAIGAGAPAAGEASGSWPVHDIDRAAVLRARRQRPLLQGLVRAHDHPDAGIPIFLCREQCGRFLLSCPIDAGRALIH